MMNGKELYDLILSNIDIFKERLVEIKKSIIQDNDAKSSKQNTKLEDISYLTIEKGVKIVSMLYKPINRFIFNVDNLEVIQHLLKKDIPVYKIGSVYSMEDYFCELKYLNYILENFASEIYEIEVPEHSIPSSLLPQILKSINVNIKRIHISSLVSR